MYRILMIDDDTEVLELNQKYFKAEGYAVKTASTAMEAIAFLHQYEADCIILDVMMPGMDGFTACAQIRKLTHAPIIFLTGKTEEDDKIRGLSAGADDYVIKPYSLRELSARINAHIKRNSFSQKDSNSNMLTIGPLSLDVVHHRAFYLEQQIELANREYELLYLFMTHPDVIMTFEEIGTALSGSYLDGDRRTVTVLTSRLRKRFESFPDLAEAIQTIWAKGYMFHIKPQRS